MLFRSGLRWPAGDILAKGLHLPEVDARDLQHNQTILRRRLDGFSVTRCACLFESDASKDLSNHPNLIRIEMARFAIERGGFFRKVHVTVLSMIELDAFRSTVWIVLELRMIR